jgi:putative flippase GtrA
VTSRFLRFAIVGALGFCASPTFSLA